MPSANLNNEILWATEDEIVENFDRMINQLWDEWWAKVQSQINADFEKFFPC